jgi:hypothetical protein
MVLHISIDLNEFTTGDIYAIVAYLWTFRQLIGVPARFA